PVRRTTHGRPRSPRKSARSSAAPTRWPTRVQRVSEEHMTATDEKTPESGDTVASTGRVARVIGPVVDVEFPADQMPEIYYALHVDVSVDADTTRTLTLEVEQHIGDMVRGAEVINTGAPIEVPVGDVTKGHVFNALGESLDVPTSSLNVEERWPIHRDPPPLDQLEPRTEMFTTGIKVIDLLTPYVR